MKMSHKRDTMRTVLFCPSLKKKRFELNISKFIFNSYVFTCNPEVKI